MHLALAGVCAWALRAGVFGGSFPCRFFMHQSSNLRIVNSAFADNRIAVQLQGNDGGAVLNSRFVGLSGNRDTLQPDWCQGENGPVLCSPIGRVPVRGPQFFDPARLSLCRALLLDFFRVPCLPFPALLPSCRPTPPARHLVPLPCLFWHLLGSWVLVQVRSE